MNFQQIRTGFRADTLFPLLAAIQSICAEQIWLGGGTLRDVLLGLHPKPDSDVDLLFFNRRETSESYEAEIEAELVERTRIHSLSVKNQARMGLVADGTRYDNLLQSVAAFPDVTIAVAARVLDADAKTALVFAPYGIPLRSRPLIQPTSRYIARHGIRAFSTWSDRKNYQSRFPDWKLQSAGRVPFEPARIFKAVQYSD